MIWWPPSSASTANQIAMTGPKKLPTAPVPKRWIRNSIVSTASAIGST